VLQKLSSYRHREQIFAVLSEVDRKTIGVPNGETEAKFEPFLREFEDAVPEYRKFIFLLKSPNKLLNLMQVKGAGSPQPQRTGKARR